jgi:hypothetical protein
MASCTKCGATLVAQARFCAACGTPVVHASVVPPAARPAGTVLHASTHHVFVAFPNGTQHWIDARYVTAGG